jgi:hypothetical protein
MARPSDKLAESLGTLKSLQDAGVAAIRAGALSRTHRERLLRAGFIREVMKGWYIARRPDEPPGESTAWYTAFWGFVADYLTARFGTDWSLGPEQSLDLHVGNWTVPKQLLVRSPAGGNKPTELLFGTSVFDMRLEMPSPEDMAVTDGLRIFNLPAALVRCSPAQFTTRPNDLRAALAIVTDASDVLGRLLAGGHSTVAGRLAGAFRNIGRDLISDEIIQTMRAAGFVVNETDPFVNRVPMAFSPRQTSPQVNRLRMTWANMRETVLASFPAPAGLPKDKTSYLRDVDGLYIDDAYHSLSIEGYKVSGELIERVRAGNWNPDYDESDRQSRNALAARGYWQAFQAVKSSVKRILDGENPGSVANKDYSGWYRELFAPSVAAGLMRPGELAGLRSGPVFIRLSRHTPPRAECVRDLMSAFFELLQSESEPAVRTVLGHFVFVYIHPYLDGNGRVGRFLMNAMIASGGYPWTIIPLERRTDYMAALEAASVEQDIEPLTQFLGGLIDHKNTS